MGDDNLSQEERARLLRAMSAVGEPELIERHLDMIFSVRCVHRVCAPMADAAAPRAQVRQQEATALIGSLWRPEIELGAIRWNWFKVNRPRMSSFSPSLRRSIAAAFIENFVTDEERALEAERFFAALGDAETATSVAQALETARRRFTFAQMFAEPFVAAVDTFVGQQD